MYTQKRKKKKEKNHGNFESNKVTKYKSSKPW